MDPFSDDEDAWPDEPEEFDPDSLGPDPPGPAADIESDEAAAVAAAEEVDDELFRAFWSSVVFLNIALAALAIGAMLVYFRGDWSRGGAALLVGAVSAAFTGRYYLQGRRHLEAKDDEADEPEADEPEDDEQEHSAPEAARADGEQRRNP